MSDRLLRHREAQKILGLGPTAYWELRRRRDDFPAAVQVGTGPRGARIFESELLQFARRLRDSAARA